VASPLRRWGPIAAVGVVVAGLVAVGLVSSDGDDGAAPPTTEPALVERPAGAVTWSRAQDEGLDVTFPRPATPGPAWWPSRSSSAPSASPTSTTTGEPPPRRHRRHHQGGGVDPGRGRPGAEPAAAADRLRRHQRRAARDLHALRRDLPADVPDVRTHHRARLRRGTGRSSTPQRPEPMPVRAAEDLGAFAVLGGPRPRQRLDRGAHARGVVCVGCPGIGDPRATVFLPPAEELPPAGPHHRVRRQPAGGGQGEHAGEALQGEERVFGHLALGMGGERRAQRPAAARRARSGGRRAGRVGPVPARPRGLQSSPPQPSRRCRRPG
jgi:hypothetical protein